jgi:hypothetical protein
MILENLDVLYTYLKHSKRHSEPINNGSDELVDYYEQYEQAETRKVVCEAMLYLIREKSVSNHMLVMRLLKLTIDEYKNELRNNTIEFRRKKENIEKALSFLEIFSVAKRSHNGKAYIWTLQLNEWKKIYEKACEHLYVSLSNDIKSLEESVVYRCTKKTCTSIYTSEWAVRNNNRCPEGHLLSLVSYIEKSQIAANLKDDLQMINTTLDPLMIIQKFKDQQTEFDLMLKQARQPKPLSFMPIEVHNIGIQTSMFQFNHLVPYTWRL